MSCNTIQLENSSHLGTPSFKNRGEHRYRYTKTLLRFLHDLNSASSATYKTLMPSIQFVGWKSFLDMRTAVKYYSIKQIERSWCELPRCSGVGSGQNISLLISLGLGEPRLGSEEPTFYESGSWRTQTGSWRCFICSI